MNKIWMAFPISTDEYVYSTLGKENSYSGQKAGIIKKLLKDKPQFSEQIKILISSDLSFFYDPIFKKIRVILEENVDNNTITKYINIYVKAVSTLQTKKAVEEFLIKNKISCQELSKTFENCISEVAIIKLELKTEI
jgi:hypothetical protein